MRWDQVSETRTPVRRHSFLRGRSENWRPYDGRAVRRIVLAARRFELARRRPGQRSGPLGHIGVEVLEALTGVVDYRTGRLEPSLDWLEAKLRRSRAAIVAAMKALSAFGFLSWVRRFEPTENEGKGPQVRQISNAYKLMLPRAAAQLLGGRGEAPLPDDVEIAVAMRKAAVAEYDREEFPTTKVGEALERLRLLVKQREFTERTETMPFLPLNVGDGGNAA